jgi:hypothetical protein
MVCVRNTNAYETVRKTKRKPATGLVAQSCAVDGDLENRKSIETVELRFVAHTGRIFIKKKNKKKRDFYRSLRSLQERRDAVLKNDTYHPYGIPVWIIFPTILAYLVLTIRTLAFAFFPNSSTAVIFPRTFRQRFHYRTANPFRTANALHIVYGPSRMCVHIIMYARASFFGIVFFSTRFYGFSKTTAWARCHVPRYTFSAVCSPPADNAPLVFFCARIYAFFFFFLSYFCKPY